MLKDDPSPLDGTLAAKPLGLVDTRGHDNFRFGLQRLGFVPQALTAGDVQFQAAGDNTVLIEYKRLAQFLQDMTSGQMMKQAAAMAEASPFATLLLEGSWTQYHDGSLAGSRVTWHQAWNALQSLQDIGLRLQLTSNLEHSVQRVLELWHYYAKEVHQSQMRQVPGDPKASILCRIGGMGPKRAKELLRLYGTLLPIAVASQEELMKVAGIGPKLARNIYELWRT